MEHTQKRTKREKVRECALRQKNNIFGVVQIVVSLVFEAMFKPPMKEGSTQEVTITDFPGLFVEVIISFLYSYHLCEDELAISAAELLGLADKYRVEALEHYLMTSFSQFVNSNTVLPLVVGADIYGAKRMNIHCLNFLILNKECTSQKCEQLNNIFATTHICRVLQSG